LDELCGRLGGDLYDRENKYVPFNQLDFLCRLTWRYTFRGYNDSLARDFILFYDELFHTYMEKELESIFIISFAFDLCDI
jgi:hypothetical protein